MNYCLLDFIPVLIVSSKHKIGVLNFL